MHAKKCTQKNASKKCKQKIQLKNANKQNTLKYIAPKVKKNDTKNNVYIYTQKYTSKNIEPKITTKDIAPNMQYTGKIYNRKYKQNM